MIMRRRDFLSSLAALLTGVTAFSPLSALAAGQVKAPKHYSFKVVHTFPHDPGAFTQGLLYHQGHLYESTGGWGTSSIRRIELDTGKVLHKRDLPRNFFGEGLALWEDRLIQLTWRSGTGFVYDLQTFEQLGTFHYPGQGWGLTEDEHGLIMSDGTSQLRRLDPQTYEEVSRVVVFEQGRPLTGLNELEYINGEVWANVFPTKRVVRIDPQSGMVTAWLDLTGILGMRQRVSPEAVANGIAWDEHGQRIFVTGKLWPVLFEIAVKPEYDDRAES